MGSSYHIASLQLILLQLRHYEREDITTDHKKKKN